MVSDSTVRLAARAAECLRLYDQALSDIAH